MLPELIYECKYHLKKRNEQQQSNFFEKGFITSKGSPQKLKERLMNEKKKVEQGSKEDGEGIIIYPLLMSR